MPCHQHKPINSAGEELGSGGPPRDPQVSRTQQGWGAAFGFSASGELIEGSWRPGAALCLGCPCPPGPCSLHSHSWLLRSRELVVPGTVLHGVIRPQGAFMQNDTQYK